MCKCSKISRDPSSSWSFSMPEVSSIHPSSFPGFSQNHQLQDTSQVSLGSRTQAAVAEEARQVDIRSAGISTSNRQAE